MRLLSFSGDSCRFGSPRSVRGPSCAYCPDCQNCLHDLRASHGQQRGVIPKKQSVVRDSDSRAKHTRRHQLDHERSKECNQQNAVGRRARPWGCRLGRRTCCWHSRSPNEAGIEAAPPRRARFPPAPATRTPKRNTGCRLPGRVAARVGPVPRRLLRPCRAGRSFGLDWVTTDLPLLQQECAQHRCSRPRQRL